MSSSDKVSSYGLPPITLLGVGACYIDTILTVPYYPEADEKLRAQAIRKCRGGNVPNTLEVMSGILHARAQSNRDVRLLLCAAVPQAGSGDWKMIDGSLKGVKKSTCLQRNTKYAASSYIIESEQDLSRTIINYNDLDEMTVDDFSVALAKLKTVDFCHFEGRIPEVTLECIRHIRRVHPSVYVSVEAEKPGRAGLQELIANADLVFFSKAWALDQGYPTARMCVEVQAHYCYQATELCCTWGAESAAIARREDRWQPWTFESFQPPKPESPVVDTVGAGDTFIAGILLGLIHSHEIAGPNALCEVTSASFRSALELATLKVQQQGFQGLGQLWSPQWD